MVRDSLECRQWLPSLLFLVHRFDWRRSDVPRDRVTGNRLRGLGHIANSSELQRRDTAAGSDDAAAQREALNFTTEDTETLCALCVLCGDLRHRKAFAIEHIARLQRRLHQHLPQALRRQVERVTEKQQGILVRMNVDDFHLQRHLQRRGDAFRLAF